MKFLFLGADNQKAYDRMKELLSKRGHSLKNISQSDDMYALFQDLKDQIVASDAIIVDSSGLSAVGEFQLAFALDADKPILLTHFTPEDTLSKNITESKNKRLYIKPYEDKLELEDALDEFIEIVIDSLDAKLFMIIPPEVNRYLDWVALHTENSKSDIVRSAVIDVANKDDDYQTFLKKTE